MKKAEVDYDIFGDSFHVRSEVDQEIIDLYRRNGCKRLVVDYRSTHVERLSVLGALVEKLSILNDEIPDLYFVDAFIELRHLHSKVRLDSLDLTGFVHLKALSLSDQTVDAALLKKSKALEDLVLTGVKLRNYEALGDLKKLKSFNLVRTSGWEVDVFESLIALELLGIYNLKTNNCNFLHRCKKLVGLLFALSPQIERLDGLPTDALKEMSLRTCKNLRSIKPGSGFPKLEKVILESCPVLESLEPLMKAKELKVLELWEQTSIADGKLRRMFENRNLTRFVFKNRKHYDLKMEEARLVNTSRKPG